MTFIILRDTTKHISYSILYLIMTNEVTDCNKKEQFIISFRWVDKGFDTHEDFIRIYNVDNIKVNTLVTATRNVMITLNTQLLNARGQCYDVAKNMCGSVLRWCKKYVWY